VQAQVEVIEDDEAVSRQLDSPQMYNEHDGVLWKTAFMFSTPVESLVWRKYKAAISEVHEFGCTRQLQMRLAKAGWSYAGSITTLAGRIRSIKTARGHGLLVVHRPEDGQGQHHAEVELQPMDGLEIKKNDRSELRLMLQDVFDPIDGHRCPE
jgi:hypothetical protein